MYMYPSFLHIHAIISYADFDEKVWFLKRNTKLSYKSGILMIKQNIVPLCNSFVDVESMCMRR